MSHLIDDHVRVRHSQYSGRMRQRPWCNGERWSTSGRTGEYSIDEALGSMSVENGKSATTRDFLPRSATPPNQAQTRCSNNGEQDVCECERSQEKIWLLQVRRV